MNISSSVKKFAIIAGLGLSVSAWADCANVKTLKFCGYQPGVSAATMPKDLQSAQAIWTKSINNCFGQYATLLTNTANSCSSNYSTTNANCVKLFNYMSESCASIVQNQILAQVATQTVASGITNGCLQNPWCGYQKGVSAATAPTDLRQRNAVFQVSYGNCQPGNHGPNPLDSYANDCNSVTTTAAQQAHCLQSFDIIGNPCAPAGVAQ
jgi:hypothetical protein